MADAPAAPLASLKTPRKYAFTFVCHPGELEVKALLLAASLRRFLRCPYELIVGIPLPPDQWRDRMNKSLRLLEKLEVRPVFVTHDLVTYPYANRIPCLDVPTNADKVVLLDTDVLCLREFHDEPRFAVPFNAKPADLAMLSVRAIPWKSVYAAVGAPMPDLSLPATVTGEFMPPYFSAVFVAVPAGIGFGRAWLDCCRTIDAMPGVPVKRPHLDQIALAAALRRLGLPFDCLDERYNYPIKFKPLGAELPYFCHYQRPEAVLHEPALSDLVGSLLESHPEIAEVMASHAGWSPLLTRRRSKPVASSRPVHSRSSPLPELIVTGIPRSGAGYLCQLLNRYERCLVLNEPVEIFPPLMKQPVPWGVPVFYRELRRDVALGKRVKTRQGEMDRDASPEAERANAGAPAASPEELIIGAKSTVALLSRLSALRRAMPAARIVACVRDPLSTIASWKDDGVQLQKADVRLIPVGHLHDPFLSGHQRAALQTIARMSQRAQLAQRRAAWWRYLAELILDQAGQLILVRYEDLVLRPETVLRSILQEWDPGALLEAIEPSAIRGKHGLLDDEDIQAIRAICSQSAAELGLDVGG